MGVVTLAEKKSFLLYISSFKQIRKLTQEQKGNLLDAIMNFQEGVPLPEMDSLVDMCFGFIADDMQRDAEKYDEIVEKRRESGRKGGKATQANQANARFAQANQANATSENQANQANQADNVNVDVNDNDNENVDVCVNDNVAESPKPKTHTIPSPDEVIRLAFQIGHHMTKEEAQEFIDYNTALGWKMEWKYALKRWFDHEAQKQDEQKNKWGNDPDQRKEYGGEIDWGY